jgi:hypothetical protein
MREGEARVEGRTNRIGGEEVERGRETEGDERLVEVPGAVLEVSRVRERAPAPIAAHKGHTRTQSAVVRAR